MEEIFPFSPQAELGRLTGWVSPTKEFFPAQQRVVGQLLDPELSKARGELQNGSQNFMKINFLIMKYL